MTTTASTRIGEVAVHPSPQHAAAGGAVVDCGVGRYSVVEVNDSSRPDLIPTARPDVPEVWVLRWTNAGIEIPWPEGLTFDEAITRWATQRAGPSQVGRRGGCAVGDPPAHRSSSSSAAETGE